MWFPKLAIQIQDQDGNKKLIAATTTGWTNELVEEGSVIVEKNDNINKSYKQDGKKRIVFVKYKDPLGYNEYKFAGIFEFYKFDNGSSYFKRIKNECELIK